MNDNETYIVPTMANDHGIGFTDPKRNRNPNWTDDEVINLLEILQEDQVMQDLKANRKKQVFFYVAQKLRAEGSEKTWEQCRIKLQNLKAQYRYVKERIPNIDEIDINNDEFLKQLIADCQGLAISPSHIRNLKFIKRFLMKFAEENGGSQMRTNTIPGPEILSGDKVLQHSVRIVSSSSKFDQRLSVNDFDSGNIMFLEDSPVQSPESISIISIDEPETKKQKKDAIENDDDTELLKGDKEDGQKYVEKFNQEMMDQFLEYQRHYSTSYVQWERDRFRQEQIAIERRKAESLEHEKQMFGVFCNTIARCNQALDKLIKEKQELQNEVKRLKLKCGEDEDEEDDDTSTEADTGIPGIICTDDF